MAGLAALTPAVAAPAHEHGLVRLDITIEPQAMTVYLEAPLQSLLGFERAPRTAPERHAAQAMLARFRNARTLFGFDPAAQCTLTGVRSVSPVLDEAGPVPPAGAQAGAPEHADLAATFEYRCARVGVLRSVDVAGLLDAFRRIERIEATVAGPAGEFRQALKRPDAQLRWSR